NPTSWGFTTCRATSGSGAGIGTAIWRPTRLTRKAARAALAGSGKVGVGWAPTSIACQPTGAAWQRMARGPTRDCVCAATSNGDLILAFDGREWIHRNSKATRICSLVYTLRSQSAQNDIRTLARCHAMPRDKVTVPGQTLGRLSYQYLHPAQDGN